MTPSQFCVAGLLGAALFPMGCTDAAAPVQPTPPPVTPPAPLVFSLNGSVTDTAYQSLVGARVEVVDGPQAGTVATVDDHGHFSMPGTFTGTVSLRASSDGYISQTQAVSAMVRPGLPFPADTQIQRWVTFYLELPYPSINIAGEYSLRLT